MLGRAPLQYQAKNGEIRGISIEVLKYIEEQTGLTYEIVPFHNWEEYSRAVEEGTVDMAVGIVDDYEGTGTVSCALTVPYLVRPAGARSNECKSRIHPAVGRI